MKENLTKVFNTLRLIETKGDNTVLMADCLKALAGIISNIPEEKEADDGDK